MLSTSIACQARSLSSTKPVEHEAGRATVSSSSHFGGGGVFKGADFYFKTGMEVLNALIGSLRGCCDALPNRRTGANTRYTMADIALAAFSVFFLQRQSFLLAHQRQGVGRVRAFEPREPVQHSADPMRQPDPRPARPGAAGAFFSFRCLGMSSRRWSAGGLTSLPPSGKPCADRAGRHRIPPLG